MLSIITIATILIIGVIGALIYKSSSFKMRIWEGFSRIKNILFKETPLKLKLQKKGSAIVRTTPYRAFIFKKELLPNCLRVASKLYLFPFKQNYHGVRLISHVAQFKNLFESHIISYHACITLLNEFPRYCIIDGSSMQNLNDNLPTVIYKL